MKINYFIGMVIVLCGLGVSTVHTALVRTGSVALATMPADTSARLVRSTHKGTLFKANCIAAGLTDEQTKQNCVFKRHTKELFKKSPHTMPVTIQSIIYGYLFPQAVEMYGALLASTNYEELIQGAARIEFIENRLSVLQGCYIAQYFESISGLKYGAHQIIQELDPDPECDKKVFRSLPKWLQVYLLQCSARPVTYAPLK